MEQRLEENNVKNENNRKKEYLRGYRSSRRRINRIDDEKSYSSYGIFVNAWMPLPEPYREEQ